MAEGGKEDAGRKEADPSPAMQMMQEHGFTHAAELLNAGFKGHGRRDRQREGINGGRPGHTWRSCG